MQTNDTCSVDDCDRLAQTRGWCVKHYKRQDRTGSLERTWDIPKEHRRCRIENCERRPGARFDICNLHYFRIRNGVELDKPLPERFAGKGCAVDGCTRKRAGEYCPMHRTRLLRHGSVDVVLYRGAASGEANRNWKGDDINYRMAHDRIGRIAAGCSHCGATGTGRRYQWALNWGAEPEARCDLEGDHLPYSPCIDDYISLCIPCHKRMDLAVIAASYNRGGKCKGIA